MRFWVLIVPFLFASCEWEEEEETLPEQEEVHILPTPDGPTYKELSSISVDGCVLKVSLGDNDEVTIEGHPSTLDSIKYYVMEIFRLPSEDHPNNCRELVKSKEDSIYQLKRGVYVELTSSPKTTYGKYIEAQDAIAVGIKSLRDDYAKSKYKADFSQLKEPLQRKIKDLFPLRIYELTTEN